MEDHGKERVKCKMVFNKETRKLIGAQIGWYGSTNHGEAIFFLGLAIQKGLTAEQIALSDFYFLPHFNKPYNYIIMTALSAPQA
jgi:pyruvate/2-oxoglutarate dehydrogenase complex dihydrolipoamide dehydrogenase (E3) component